MKKTKGQSEPQWTNITTNPASASDHTKAGTQTSFRSEGTHRGVGRMSGGGVEAKL